MPAHPTDQELLAFIDAMLSNLDGELPEPAVLAQALSDHRGQWVMLYNASLEVVDRSESNE